MPRFFVAQIFTPIVSVTDVFPLSRFIRETLALVCPPTLVLSRDFRSSLSPYFRSYQGTPVLVCPPLRGGLQGGDISLVYKIKQH